MSQLQFIPVQAENLDAFVHITSETLWMPAWPGDVAVTHDFLRWPAILRSNTFLIYAQQALVGRVVAPLLDGCLHVRDLGLKDQFLLPKQVGEALLQRAHEQQAHQMRIVVSAAYWPTFEQFGFVEVKRRTNMALDLQRTLLPASSYAETRNISGADGYAIGELLFDAYRDTIDDEGEDQPAWAQHVRDIIEAQYGSFLSVASYVTPLLPPFQSVTLVVENAPRCAMLAQVATRKTHGNRGHARRLIAQSLLALERLHYQRCVLETTMGNANAQHLYRSLGFVEIGPQLVHGLKALSG